MEFINTPYDTERPEVSAGPKTSIIPRNALKHYIRAAAFDDQVRVHIAHNPVYPDGGAIPIPDSYVAIDVFNYSSHSTDMGPFYHRVETSRARV